MLDAYWKQERDKKENRDQILRLLNQQNMSFSQLRKATGYSPTGLSTMLKDLVKEQKIQKVDPKNEKSPYKLKSTGFKVKEFLFPGSEINDLRLAGKYYYDLPGHHSSEIFNYEPAFGITSHLLIDRKITNNKLLWKKELFEIERFVYEKIIEEQKGKTPLDEKLFEDDKTNKKNKNKVRKKGFLILEIDFSKLVKIIKTCSSQKNQELVNDKIKELELNP